MSGPDPRGASLPHDGEVLDVHLAAEFEARDIEATMATMPEDPYLNHVPMMTGGIGRDAVRAFYERFFIPVWPEDIDVASVSRTEGQDRVVDELILSFTHDQRMDFLLPGVEPTGRSVSLPFVVVVGFEDGKVAYQHIYWDQASLLVQVGLLDPALMPATGAEQAAKVRDPRGVPCRELG
ncbi:MAG: nuclear transport factor 2 family protein [Thermoleophilaceae bacterium]|nr:nuclear transport factor 2 family protein [Thermoleophilaceae bacterium]